MSGRVAERYVLSRENELRIEVEGKEDIVELVLKTGTAEIFGRELAPGVTYTFRYGDRVAIFTWHGCDIQVLGKPDYTYSVRKTPMPLYFQIHAYLEQLREAESRFKKHGPIVLVTGSYDTGKSILCKSLINFGLRMENNPRTPIFVDLDVAGGDVTIPGTIGATCVTQQMSIEDGFQFGKTFVCSFGHTKIQDNPALFDLLISRIGKAVDMKLKHDDHVRSSGVIINGFGWVKGRGYRHLKHVINCLNPDLIVIMGTEKLYHDLIRDLPLRKETMSLVPKSGGVVEKNESMRNELIERCIKEYFYGTRRRPLCPHAIDLRLSNVKIYRIGAPALPESCLPIGMKYTNHLTKAVLVIPDTHLLHQIMSISYGTNEKEVVEKDTLGFVCVTGIDILKGTLTVLSPQKPPLPSSVFVVFDVSYIDRENNY